MSRKKISRDDRKLFRESVGMINPYVDPKVASGKPKPAPIPKNTLADEKQVLVDMISDAYEPIEAFAGDQLLFAKPGLQSKTLRKLKRGQFRISAELDLHGLTVALARQSLVEFLQHCVSINARCVRIIHGKGRRSGQEGPVLKQKLTVWLPQRDEVLAFCSAIPAHGGTGAAYVLLRREK